MKVHYVHEVYSNNVTKRITMFSSLKKAEKYVDEIVSFTIRHDHWTKEVDHVYRDGGKFAGVRLIPPSKNMYNSELLFIFSAEVK
jgi:hypothetical protein